MNKNVQRRIRRNSIEMARQVEELSDDDKKSLNSDLGNLSNEGSDDEDAVNYFKFKRMNSIDYIRSPVRSRSISAEKPGPSGVKRNASRTPSPVRA